MRRFCLVVSFLLILGFAGVHQTLASQPVPKTITGCVINGTLHSLHTGKSEATGRQTLAAYPITVRDLDLTPYEGKKIHIQGNLLPGDRFFADPKSIRVIGPCDKESQKTITREAAGAPR